MLLFLSYAAFPKAAFLVAGNLKDLASGEAGYWE